MFITFVLDFLQMLSKETPSISNKEHPKNNFDSYESEKYLKHTQIDFFVCFVFLTVATLGKSESVSAVVTSRRWRGVCTFNAMASPEALINLSDLG